MSVYALCKAVHHLYIDRDAARAAAAGDFSSIDGSDLTADERAALLRKDIVALYRLGVHPVLLFHFSAVLHGREHYVKEVVPNIQGVPNPYYDHYERPP